MADNISALAIYLLPGLSIKIKVPIMPRNSTGFWALEGSDPPEGFFRDMLNVSEMTRGFVVEDEKIGAISSSTGAAEVAVIYTHKKPAKNAIWFFSATGEIGLINIITVPIHDHSNILQGGPAFGTYFDDSEGSS